MSKQRNLVALFTQGGIISDSEIIAASWLPAVAEEGWLGVVGNS